MKLWMRRFLFYLSGRGRNHDSDIADVMGVVGAGEPPSHPETGKPISRKEWHCLTAVTPRIQIDIAPRYLSGILRTEHNGVCL
jgi:hypothetical protein